jgi:hypothetical protein
MIPIEKIAHDRSAVGAHSERKPVGDAAKWQHKAAATKKICSTRRY